MASSAIIPVILGGGAGTRLWPLSRPERPKQFLDLGPPGASARHSLFARAVLRSRGLPFDPRPVVVGAQGHHALLAGALQRIGTEADVVLEPVARDTCAAVAAGCLQAAARAPGALVAVLAADHHIPDADAFAEGFVDAADDARDGRLVTFGIRPDRPATGYGYILPGERLRRALAVARFVEKPAAAQAERLLAEGWLWNSGNFLFRADAFLAELERLRPDILAAVRAAHAGAGREGGALLLDAASFAAAPAIAVDRAVMERTERAAVLPVAYRWSDLGSWDALAEMPGGDAVAGEAARPWGSYERLGGDDGHEVARVTVAPGATMPPDGHTHGARRWLMVAGEVEASAGGRTRTLCPGRSMRTSPGAALRLVNRGALPAVLIELRTLAPA